MAADVVSVIWAQVGQDAGGRVVSSLWSAQVVTTDRSSRPRECEGCGEAIEPGLEHKRSAGGCFYHDGCAPAERPFEYGARVNDVHLHAVDTYRLVLRHWKGERR